MALIHACILRNWLDGRSKRKKEGAAARQRTPLGLIIDCKEGADNYSREIYSFIYIYIHVCMNSAKNNQCLDIYDQKTNYALFQSFLKTTHVSFSAKVPPRNIFGT